MASLHSSSRIPRRPTPDAVRKPMQTAKVAMIIDVGPLRAGHSLEEALRLAFADDARPLGVASSAEGAIPAENQEALARAQVRATVAKVNLLKRADMRSRSSSTPQHICPWPREARAWVAHFIGWASHFYAPTFDIG